MERNNRTVGTEGEDSALAFLTGSGYRLRHRNYRTRHGELDLILDAPDHTVVFCEVKRDRTGKAGSPESWVNNKKIRQIQRTALAYCTEFGLKDEVMRFDVISISKQNGQPGHTEIRHIKNAFIPDTGNYY